MPEPKTPQAQTDSTSTPLSKQPETTTHDEDNEIFAHVLYKLPISTTIATGFYDIFKGEFNLFTTTNQNYL